MPHGKDRGHVVLVPIKYDIPGVAKPNEPLPKISPRRFNPSTNIRMGRQRSHAQADRANCAPCHFTVLRRKERGQTCHIVQRRGCPNDPRHASTMWLGWLEVLAVFQAFEP